MRTAIILFGALFLFGCAKVGTLDQPAPLFGEKAKEHYRAEKAAEAAAKAKKDDDGAPEPLPTQAEAAAGNTTAAPAPSPAPEPTLPPVAPQ
jgi:hypothetical protein